MSQENIDDILGINPKSHKSNEFNANISNSLIDPSYIIKAGRQLKNIVAVIIISILLSFILFLVAKSYPTYYMDGYNYHSNDKTIKMLFYIPWLIALIANIIILFLLFKTGDNLEKSVTENAEIEINNTALSQKSNE